MRGRTCRAFFDHSLVLFLVTVAAAPPAAAGDAFYQALLGLPEVASPRELLAGPGQYVGRAITTRGRLERTGGGPAAFRLATSSGAVLLKLEPEVAGLVATRASEWVGRQVEVDGLFYRDAGSRAMGSHALRAWRVAPVGGDSSGPARQGPAAPLVRIEDLIYARGSHDGRLVRVRGVVRGPAERDLPEATRQRGDDWVLKEGYFAVWVTGRNPVAAATSVVAVEVVGVPTTAAGVVRIAAHDVAAIDPSQVTVTRPPVSFQPHAAAPAPRVSFTHPGPGDPLGPRGHVIIQFNHPMDPASFLDGVRARYEGRDPAPTGVRIEYRHRHRALVITPREPPAGRPLVVELLDVVVDVNGGGLVPRAGTVPRGDVVEEIRFSNAP